MPLTKNQVERSKPKEKSYDIRDGGAHGVTGLILRVYPSGRRTFFYQRHRREKWYRLGQAGPITLEMARSEATRIYTALQLGKNPVRAATSESEGNQGSHTLRSFLDRSYRPHFEARHKNSRHLQNLKSFELWFDEPLSYISEIRVENWRTKRLNAGVKAATVNRNVSALKTALKYAVKIGVIESQPLESIVRLQVYQENRVRYLTESEEKRLWAALASREDRIKKERESARQWGIQRGYETLPSLSNYKFADHLKPMVMLSLNTGVRQGELFQLRWQDMVDEVITIGSGITKNRKTRRVPLNSIALDALNNWRDQASKGAYVFSNRNGEPFDNVKKSWKAVLQEAQIDDFRWHDMRHHFASMLVMGGRAADASGDNPSEARKDRLEKQRRRSVPLNTVRELLGHGDLQMTMRYAHLSPGQLRDAVEAITL